MRPKDSNTLLKNLTAGENYHALRSHVSELCKKYHRDPNSVSIVGASKRQATETIQSALDSGLKDLGENFVGEAIEKQKQITDPTISWHYIGSIQSNKTKQLAQHFTWIHTVERLKIARRLNNHIKDHDRQPLNILLQVNIDEESSKSGIAPNDLLELTRECLNLSHLRVRGIMVIPKVRDDFTQQCQSFRQTRELMDSVNQRLSINLDHLSMGMSNDLEAAIKEGATMVRVGTSLFGERNT